MSSAPFLVFAALGYLVSSVLYGAYLLNSQRRAQIAFLHAGRLVGCIGLFLHTAAIGLHCIHSRHTPISTTSEALSATGWAMVILYLALEVATWKKPPTAIGAVAYPLAFLSVFTGSTLAAPAHAAGQRIGLLDSSLVSLHILAIVFAFGLLTLAAVCSVFYLIEHRLLKQKRVLAGIFAKLPPLTTVDHLAFSLVCFAFPLLSIGCIAGIIRAASASPSSALWMVDAKTLATLVCWGFYGLYLWAHATSNWQGIRSNYLLLGGLAAALVTYLAPSTLHHFS